MAEVLSTSITIGMTLNGLNGSVAPMSNLSFFFDISKAIVSYIGEEEYLKRESVVERFLRENMAHTKDDFIKRKLHDHNEDTALKGESGRSYAKLYRMIGDRCQIHQQNIVDDEKRNNQKHSRDFQGLSVPKKETPPKSSTKSAAAPAVVVGGQAYTFEPLKGKKRADMTQDEKAAHNKLNNFLKPKPESESESKLGAKAAAKVTPKAKADAKNWPKRKPESDSDALAVTGTTTPARVLQARKHTPCWGHNTGRFRSSPLAK